LRVTKKNFQFSIFPPAGDLPQGDNLQGLTIAERIFITAGILSIIAVPFLELWGFSAWLAVKSVYLIGLIILYVRH